MEDLVLPSVFRVAELAHAAVTAAHTEAAAFLARRDDLEPAPRVAVSHREAALAFRSERYLLVGGEPIGLWEPLSGDYETVDGWIRLHCNFPHHAAAACRALGVPEDRDAVAAAARARGKEELEEAVVAEGGAAAAMRTRDEWLAHPQAAALAAATGPGAQPYETGPLASEEAGSRSGPDEGPARRPPALHGPAGRPLAGIRVLDLTRVIAGPVAARVLAGYGADVTMVRAAHLPTIAALDLDLGIGKALRYLDLRTAPGRAAFLDLVRSADILVQSYRPGALAALGLGPDDLAAVNPALVHVSVSAYGGAGPWGARRGFDSLVQMATGIAEEGMRAAGAHRPTPLPAQALDHVAGWYAAAGAVRALSLGGGRRVAVSLARMACELDRLGRVDPAVGLAVPDPAAEDVAPLSSEFATRRGPIRYLRMPGRIEGVELGWPGPSPTT
jgi:crotonobetainyl-CoA:carnitine CoA-transferase CaiB-like acyl-CoA transferase